MMSAVKQTYLCLAALAAPATPIPLIHDPVLSAVSPAHLPAAREPQELFTTGPRTAHGTSGSAPGPVFYDKQVKEWLDASVAVDFPHPESRGWRIVAHPGIEKTLWCARRVWFETIPDNAVTASNCDMISGYDTHLTSQYHPRNAFNDDASDGCSAKEPGTGDFYIGLRCERTFKVQRIRILQQDPATNAFMGRVQQLRAGQWIEIGDPVRFNVNVVQVIFEAAVCHASICQEEFTLKPRAQIPKTCTNPACSVRECCDRKDSCSFDTCTSPLFGLKSGLVEAPTAGGPPELKKPGTRCATATCTEDFCCEQKGECTAGFCRAQSSPQVLLEEPPELCAGESCTVAECCRPPRCQDQPAVCAAIDGASQKPSAELPSSCANPTCTFTECCNSPPSIGSGHYCEESVCASSLVRFDDMKFNHLCSAVCTQGECCTAIIHPRLWSVPAALAQGFSSAIGVAMLTMVWIGFLAVVVTAAAALCIRRGWGHRTVEAEE